LFEKASVASLALALRQQLHAHMGDVVEEMVGAVKAAVQQCCAQLRVSGKGRSQLPISVVAGTQLLTQEQPMLSLCFCQLR
jgi:hypothetical protein